MANELSLAKRLEVGVNLPGKPGVFREIPSELLEHDVNRVINYVLDSPYFEREDKSIAKAIRDEMKYGAVFTVYVAKNNAEQRVDGSDRIGRLFEVDPKTRESQYQKLVLTVSSPREGG